MITNGRHIIIVSTVAISGSLLYFIYNPASSGLFPPCPFYSLTNLFCPGCGSQRAFHELLHGNILSSADHNLLFVAALPLVGYSAIAHTASILFRKRISQQLFHSTGFAITIFILIIAFWLLRNIGTAPFVWLAP